MIVNYRSKICKGNTIANKRLVYLGLAGILFTLYYYLFCILQNGVVIALNCQNRLQQWRCNKRLKLVTLTYLSTHSANYEIMYLPCNNDWNEKIQISQKVQIYLRVLHIQNYFNFKLPIYPPTKNPPKKSKVKKVVRFDLSLL